MRSCCPPGRGCNSHEAGQTCALELLTHAAEDSEEARLALERWAALQSCRGAGAGERRFRQRGYERARDRALIGLALSSAA